MPVGPARLLCRGCLQEETQPVVGLAGYKCEFGSRRDTGLALRPF